MRLFNQTKNIILAEEIFLAHTFFSRSRGLLNKRNFPSGQGIILAPCKAVHTFFMRFPIDLIFVDKNYKVLKLLANIKPNRLTGICWSACKVVELPAGTLKLTHTQVFDQLLLS